MFNADALPDDVATLKAMVLAESQRADTEAIQLAIERRKNRELEEIVEDLRRQLFGRKSERLNGPNENQLKLFESNDPTVSTEEIESEEQDNINTPVEPQRKKRKKGRKKGAPGRQGFPANLPRIPVTATEPGPTSCPCCGDDLKLIGYDMSERLEKIPTRYVVLVVKRAKRACSRCPEQGVLTQPAPPFFQERSKYADGLVAQVIVDKYADHLPLRRQIKRFKRDKIHIPISNLCRMIQHSAGLLKHVVNAMRLELLASDFIQADETGLPILHGSKNKPKKGVLWICAQRKCPWGIPMPNTLYLR